LVTTRMVCLQI